MRFIQDLSLETQNILRRLHKQSQHHRVRQRAHCILLSFQGMTTTELLKVFDVERLTLYNWFNAWDTRRLAGLYDHKGCGLRRLKPSLRGQYFLPGIWPRRSPISIDFI